MPLPPVAITVAYEELQGSPVESFTDKGLQATRELVCAWGDRFTFINQLLGAAEDSGTGTITYIQPQPYPHAPSSAFASSASMKPFDEKVMADGGDTTLAAYQKAQVSVNYTQILSQIFTGGSGGDVSVEERIEPFAEFLTLPPIGLFWGSTTGMPLKPEEAPPKLMKGFNWVYTKHKVTTIPAAVYSLVGKVNQAAVTSISLGYTFAAQTLLYNPPVLTRTVIQLGDEDFTLAWDLEFRFTFRPDGWNKFWRTETGAFEQIFNAAGAVSVYTPDDFTIL